MKNLTVDLEYCYGISKLKHAFCFSEDKRTYAIYAPNGSMKTSFAKTFFDYSQKVDSSDLIFKDRKSKRIITEDGNGSLEPEQVFVLEPYNDTYVSQKTSTLLVNKELKKHYDDIWSKVEKLKEALIDELKKPAGMRTGIEDEISVTFSNTKAKFINAMQRVKSEVLEDKEPIFDRIQYKVIFNDKVIKFLSDDKIKVELKEYIDRYDELIEKSKYFRKGIFNHTNASTVAKSLVANGFFEASHTVSLSDESDSGKSEITSQIQLEAVIQQEMEEILSDEKLLKAFEKIDKKLSNQELKAFRDYLVLHKDLIPELNNLAGFKDRIWIDYLKACKEAYKALIETYEQAEKDLKQIEEQAKKERTKWLQVVDTFNERFNVPFTLGVKNQEDVILKSDLPVLGFEFKDGAETKEVNEEDLRRVLSNGEKKALYILNLLFEIEARKDEDLETLLIVDDIADSFDYKNKYAIIEYLKDNVDHEKFYQIILTHNFDFFRTVQSRFPVGRDCCLMVNRKADGLELVTAAYIKNPFRHFLKHTDDDSMFLSLIPFMRNLIEYTKGEDDPQFIQLTSVLHQKSDTSKITKKDINDIINQLFPNGNVTLSDPTKIVAELFIEKAEELLPLSESLMLENKIVLSIAIRLKAEAYLVKNILDKAFVVTIKSNQTSKLIDKYTEENLTRVKESAVFKRVNLITPQNIHLNSFMYEPILDMSDVELKSLYRDVSALA
jgi:hemoglobin-like flavoprotein